MVVVVIPNNKSDAYAMVKKTCLIQKPTSRYVKPTNFILRKYFKFLNSLPEQAEVLRTEISDACGLVSNLQTGIISNSAI